MTVGALNNGFSPSTRLDCSSGFQVGNRLFKNYESGAYGYIGFAKALQLSCDTFFYRVGLDFWQQLRLRPHRRQRQGPAGRRGQGRSASASETGIDLPGEASGPDRRPALEARLLQGDEGLLLQARPQAHRRPSQRLPARLRPRVLPRGLRTTAPATP